MSIRVVCLLTALGLATHAAAASYKPTLWVNYTGAPSLGASSSTDDVFFLATGPNVTAHDAGTGHWLWQKTLPSDPVHLSAGADGMVVAVCNLTIVALSSTDGAQMWETPLPADFEDVSFAQPT